MAIDRVFVVCAHSAFYFRLICRITKLVLPELAEVPNKHWKRCTSLTHLECDIFDYWEQIRRVPEIFVLIDTHLSRAFEDYFHLEEPEGRCVIHSAEFKLLFALDSKGEAQGLGYKLTKITRDDG